jgi:hypothetical protein
MAAMIPEPVMFITIEDENDATLVLSFAIDVDDPPEVASLILYRDFLDRRILPPAEWGVHVSHELEIDPDEDEPDVLRRIRITRTRVDIQSARHKYHLDVSKVDRDDLREAEALLRRMNVDNCFELEVGEA